MLFTRLELHKPCAFERWDNLDSRRGWRTIYHREGRRSARQKVGQLIDWYRAQQHLDAEPHEYTEHNFCCVDCLRGEEPVEIRDLKIHTHSPLWSQISALKELRPTW